MQTMRQAAQGQMVVWLEALQELFGRPKTVLVKAHLPCGVLSLENTVV